MINKDSKISLTYTLGGECLVLPGIYSTAKVTVTNPYTKIEVVKVEKPMVTHEPAIYSKAEQTVTLDSSFVQMALEQPKKPEDMNYHRWLRTPLGKIAQEWRKMKDEQKIAFHVGLYVMDMGGEDYTYEIM